MKRVMRKVLSLSAGIFIMICAAGSLWAQTKNAQALEGIYSGGSFSGRAGRACPDKPVKFKLANTSENKIIIGASAWLLLARGEYKKGEDFDLKGSLGDTCAVKGNFLEQGNLTMTCRLGKDVCTYRDYKKAPE